MTVRLPRAQPGVVALGPRGVPQQAGGASPPLGARVLIVDDNEDAAELLASALTARGCETHVVHDGPQALRIGALQQFDAALLDIGLPVMDGYELATRLRELPSFRDAVLIAVTGYGQDADRQRALAAGFHHHMIKPVDLQSILTKLPRVSSARSV